MTNLLELQATVQSIPVEMVAGTLTACVLAFYIVAHYVATRD